MVSTLQYQSYIMKTDSTILLQELLGIAKQDKQSVINLQKLSDAQLNYKPSPERWSILECLEHLNLYAAFYLPKIEKAVSKEQSPRQIFKSGFFGNKLVNMVKPVERSKKIKTFKAMDPDGKIVTHEVLNSFLDNHKILISLIEKAADTNLNKAAVPVTFTSLIKLRTGDALRFMVHHHQRHIKQALHINV